MDHHAVRWAAVLIALVFAVVTTVITNVVTNAAAAAILHRWPSGWRRTPASTLRSC